MKISNLFGKSTLTVLLLLTFVLLTSGFLAQTKKPSSPDIGQIAALLDKHDNAMNQKDLDAIVNLYDPGPKTVMMGTGPGEFYQGREQIKQAYTEIFKDYDKGTVEHNCYQKTGEVNGNTAWLTAMCKFSDSHDGKKREYELNVSGVVKREGAEWYFSSLHFSNLTGNCK